MLCNEYKLIHKTVSKVRGFAKNYRCVDCQGAAQDWAWIDGTCKNDIVNYEPKCHKCHLGKDLAGNQNALGHIGLEGSSNPSAKLDEGDVLAIRELWDTKGWSMSELGRTFNVSRRTIYNVINRKCWSHVV